MPKILSKYSVTAWDESKSLLERITPSKNTRAMYSQVCAPRRVIKPKTVHPKTRPLTAEECKQLMEEWVGEVAEKTLLSKLVLEERKLDKKSLINRISSAIPLEDRLSPTTPRPEYVVKEAPLDKLHFNKTKYLLRIQEVRPMFDTVLTRLEPILNKLNYEDQREDEGLPVQVPSEQRQKLWKMLEDLRDRYEEFDTQGAKWSNAKWRRLTGALKRIGKVYFDNLEKNFTQICTQLAELNLTFDDL
ncbi:hypothetical protein PsYK624_153820 [Phanerochaete sordida]|uniref:Uncharacterized protein n=1 Tax=Phanerochaete sordida TaxID=48140 RepID=A0A9P3GT38_9APHY|nr:hypothetical protein PsYK624_153820 [Phanerochaete sordida]